MPENEAAGQENGLPDDWKRLFGVTDPLDDLLDYDGLSSAMEYILGTHPHASDSDGDGVDDHLEIAYGTEIRWLPKIPTRMSMAMERAGLRR